MNREAEMDVLAHLTLGIEVEVVALIEEKTRHRSRNVTFRCKDRYL